MQLVSKLPDIGTTIFTVMSKMALEHNSINLGQGFPDFNPDQRLLDLVTEAMNAGHNQYPYMPGVEILRQVIADKVNALYGKQYDKDSEITVTSGATEAIMSAVTAVVHAGDEVIVIEPSYDCYLPAIKLSGGVPVRVSMTPPASDQETFSIDWNKVSDAITSRTRLIILNFPHNPTGAVLQPEDLDSLEQLVANTNILLLSDEVYEHIVFAQQGHLSVASRELLAERAFVISSFGKTTHTTGWKIGYCCAPKSLTAELRKVHQFVVFTVPSPLQHGMANFIANPDTYRKLPDFYRAKRDRLYEGLKRTKFRPYICPGTFFLLANYSEISNLDEADFSMWLTKEHGVTVIPVSAFYADSSSDHSNHHIVRFCFAKQDATLDLAIEQLMTL